MDPLGGLGKSQQVNGQAAIDDQGKKGRDDRADDKLEQERNLMPQVLVSQKRGNPI